MKLISARGRMKRIYIHVGMPKTGTTFLQERFFPNLKGLCYVHTTNYSPIAQRGFMGLLRRIVYTNPAFYDLQSAKEEARELLQAVDEELVLISWERLFGNMFANYFDNFYITNILKALFPTARIIMIIRRQDELLDSIYRQTLHSYHHQTVNSFLNYANESFGDANPRVPHSNLDVKQFDYRRYIRNYGELFGRDNIEVLPYELLKTDQGAFLDKLCAFMQVEPFYPAENNYVHESYSLLASYIALLLNRFVRIRGDGSRLLQLIPDEPFSSYLAKRNSESRFYKLLEKVNRRLSLRYFLREGVDRVVYVKGKLISDEKRRLIINLHKESNRLLDEELKLGLDRFGYY